MNWKKFNEKDAEKGGFNFQFVSMWKSGQSKFTFVSITPRLQIGDSEAIRYPSLARKYHFGIGWLCWAFFIEYTTTITGQPWQK